LHIDRPENPLFGAEIFVMSHIQAQLKPIFYWYLAIFVTMATRVGLSKIRMTPFDWLTPKTPSLVQKM